MEWTTGSWLVVITRVFVVSGNAYTYTRVCSIFAGDALTRDHEAASNAPSPQPLQRIEIADLKNSSHTLASAATNRNGGRLCSFSSSGIVRPASSIACGSNRRTIRNPASISVDSLR